MLYSLNIKKEEFESRSKNLLNHIKENRLNGVVLFDNYYILYFTGFAFIPTERPIAFFMNADGEKGLFVPRLELEHAKSQTGFEYIEYYIEYPSIPHPAEILKQILIKVGIKDKIGADNDGYPSILGYRGPSLKEITDGTIIFVNHFIEDMMMIKSEAEINLIKESVKWGNLAHRLLQRYTKVGLTETEVSFRASYEATLAMYNTLGHLYRGLSIFSEGASAGYRGQIGRNASIPHALANNITFQEGDVLVSGASACIWGYNSELERTMIIGEPSKEQKELFLHMKKAQEIAFENLRPGIKCSDVDKAVKNYYTTNHLEHFWKHHTGHAIGLRYHEGPFLDIGDETIIKPGMVFTIEPGFYSSEIGGFRHSDTVLITQTGIEILTYYPRELECLIIPKFATRL